MKAGSGGTFVISWSQTEIDGLRATLLDILQVRTLWCLAGVHVRMDGSQGILHLDGAASVAEVCRRAARMVRRLIGRLR